MMLGWDGVDGVFIEKDCGSCIWIQGSKIGGKTSIGDIVMLSFMIIFGLFKPEKLADPHTFRLKINHL